jgi:hypothetical protein
VVTAGKFSRCAFEAVDVFRANKMKVVVVCAAAISLAGCDAFGGKADVYKMPVARAYHKLMNAAITPSGKGPFGRLEIDITGIRNQLVEWTIKASRSDPLCTASLKPVDAEQTRIAISCKGGDGPADGMLAKLLRSRVIEHVDATLKNRPFDPGKADDGATAAAWPKDVIDHGNLGTAAAKALEMDRKTAEDFRQVSRNR